MTGTVNVRVDRGSVEQARADLDGVKNGFVRAYARALNKAVDGTQAEMVRMARDDYTFKVAAVKSRMSTMRATWSNLNARVESKGPAVPLTDFAGTRQTSTGLSVNIKRSTGLQRLPHAFITRGQYSGKLIPFWRAKTTDSIHPASLARQQLAQAISSGHITTAGRVWRYPILDLYGPHPEVVWNTTENWAKLSREADDRMMAAFAYEVDYVLQQYG